MHYYSGYSYNLMLTQVQKGQRMCDTNYNCCKHCPAAWLVTYKIIYSIVRQCSSAPGRIIAHGHKYSSMRGCEQSRFFRSAYHDWFQPIQALHHTNEHSAAVHHGHRGVSGACGRQVCQRVIIGELSEGAVSAGGTNRRGRGTFSTTSELSQMIADQDADEWYQTMQQGAELFTKNSITAAITRLALRRVVVCPYVSGRAK